MLSKFYVNIVLESVTKRLHTLPLGLFKKNVIKCEKQKKFHEFQNNYCKV